MDSCFRIEFRQDVALVTFDEPGSKVNTLGTASLTELLGVLGRVESRAGVRGMILRSGKSNQCIAGANLREIAALAEGDPELLRRFIALGHRVIGHVGSLPFPTIGILNGPTLGGGLELMLACDALVAADLPKTALGLPEVTLGLIPAWGGTQRLPRQMAVAPALRCLLSGSNISAHEAQKLGVVTSVSPPENLENEAINVLMRCMTNAPAWKLERARRREALSLDEAWVALTCEDVCHTIKGLNRDTNPAIDTLLDVVRRGLTRPMNEALEIEAEAALQLFCTAQARNRIYVFFLRTWKARENERLSAPRGIERLGVLGAGMMGAGIAAVAGARGLDVTVVDIDETKLNAARQRSETAAVRAGTPSFRISTSTRLESFAGCELIIEALPEKEDLKRDVLSRLARLLVGQTVIATNTSSLSVGRLAEAVLEPDRFGGLHFFNPVERMELVEVVAGPATSKGTESTLFALARQLGRTALRVCDCPGFLVNRMLFAYLREALRLAEEDEEISVVDAAAISFGLPMGPFALLDLVGLDTAAAILRVLEAAFGERFGHSSLLDALVRRGTLGRKTGEGFYKVGENIDRGVLARPRPEHDLPLARRQVLPMLLEATRILGERIVVDPRDVDLGTILGLGFPMWRGGVLRWADLQGAAPLVQELEHYVCRFGSRFQPTLLLLHNAREGQTFHAPKNA